MSDVRDRSRGTLLGLAWGDVLGSPMECWRPAPIRAIFGDCRQLPEQYPLDRIARLGKKVLRRMRPLGLHSDDTQQAMALINVCLAGWSPEAWAGWLVHGMKQKAWRGYGRNFSSSIRRMAKGRPPRAAGTATGGIGAAMRIAPLGALYRDDHPRLARVAMESSFCTHGDIRAGALAFAIAHAAFGLIAGRTAAEVRADLPAAVAFAEKEWLEAHEDWKIDRTAGHLISRSLEEVFTAGLNEPERIRAKVSALGRPHLAKGFLLAHPNQGFVLLGGLHGLVLPLLLDEEPGEVLAEIVRQGYDTDTVAAICGGLLGARHGTAWIPVDRLGDRRRVERYADALVERREPPEDLETFTQCEANWTRLEVEYQKSFV